MSVLYGAESRLFLPVSGRLVSFSSMNTEDGLSVSDSPVKLGPSTLRVRKSGPALYSSFGGNLKYVSPIDVIHPINKSVVEDIVDESLCFSDPLDVYCSSDSSYSSAPSFLFDASNISVVSDGSPVTSYVCPFSGIPLRGLSTFVSSSQGGLPSVLTSAGEYLYTDDFTMFPSGEFTIFAVMKIVDMSLYDGVLCFSAVGEQDYSNANGFTLEKGNTTTALRCTHRAGQTFEYDMAFPFNQFALFTWVRSSSLASTVAYRGLGVEIGRGNGPVSSPINSTRFAFSARVNPSNISSASGRTMFSEVAVFNSALSASDISLAQQALTLKYGL